MAKKKKKEGLRPGESFLSASARVKHDKPESGAAVIQSFQPGFIQPLVPPVPKSVKDWDKKTPKQKMDYSGGFVQAVANERAVTRYKYERMAPITSRSGRVEAKDPALVQRDLKAYLAAQRPDESGPQSFLAGLASITHGWRGTSPTKTSDKPDGEGYGDTLAGIYEATSPLRHYLGQAETWLPQQGGLHPTLMGVPAPKIINDAFEMGAKMVVGGGAGLAHMGRHPLSILPEVKAIIFDAAQPIGLALAAVPGQRTSEAARKKLFGDFIAAAQESMVKQYGPEVSWSSSVRQSYDQGTMAFLTGLGVVATTARVLGGIPRVARMTGEYGGGLRAAVAARGDAVVRGDHVEVEIRDRGTGQPELKRGTYVRTDADGNHIVRIGDTDYTVGQVKKLDGTHPEEELPPERRKDLGYTRDPVGREPKGDGYVSPIEAWKRAYRPPTPRTLRFRGGSEATGVDVEAFASRSPFMRHFLQGPYDWASRRVPQETRFIGGFSESRRAGRIMGRRQRRQRRRDLAVAENALREAGLASEGEQLRVMFNRDKPDSKTEHEWLQDLLQDVTNMLEGEEIKSAPKETQKVAKLRRRVEALQRKVDVEGSLTEEEDRLVRRIDAAAARGVPTERAEAQLANIRERLAVARGEEVPPLPDSPGRVKMKEVYSRQLPPEQVEVVMAVADRLARAANPENPSAWLDRIVTRWAETAADVRLDPVTAMLQEREIAKIPSEAELRPVVFDGVDLSVFREHDIDGFLRQIPEYLRRGAPYRYWYEDSGKEILDFANGDKDLAARVAQVVAVMSASRNPRENINLALEAVRQWQAGRPIDVTTAPQNAKAEAIMRGENWEGRKTNRFYANMLKFIDEDRYLAEFPGGEVTNDIWMARLFGLKTDVPTPREYDQMTKIQQNIAAALGWEPEQIQAALWVPAKADAGRVITGPGGKKIRAPLSDYEAGIDFARALREESVAMPVSAQPGRRTAGDDLLRNYHDLDPEERTAYLGEKTEAVRQFLVDAEVFGRIEAQAVDFVESGANFTLTIPSPVERLGTGRISEKTGKEIQTPVSWTTPTARKQLTQVMSIIGEALQQDAMTWFRPIYRRDKPPQQNGILLKTSRPLTGDEQLRLHSELKHRLGGDVAVVPAPDGHLYLLNHSKAKNVTFHATAGEILGEINDANEVQAGPVLFRFDGEYRTRSRYTKTPLPLGAEAARAGRPDVREAAHRLGERSDEIDRRYLGSPERPVLANPAAADPLKVFFQEAKVAATRENTNLQPRQVLIVRTEDGPRLARTEGGMDEEGNVLVRMLYGDRGTQVVNVRDIELTPAAGRVRDAFFVQGTRWISPLVEAVRGLPDKIDRASLEAKLAKSPGVKEAERTFTGLPEILDNLFKDKKSITRDELLNAVATHSPKFETEHLGGDEAFYEHQFDVTMEGPRTDYWEQIYHWPERIEPITESDYEWAAEDLPPHPEPGDPGYDPDNYWTDQSRIESAIEDIQRHRQERTLYTAPHWVQEQGPNRYGDDHPGYEHNLLMSMRMSERTFDAEPTDSVEEYQSDWHQDGRKQGYALGTAEERAAQRDAASARLEAADNARNQARIDLADATWEALDVGDLVTTRYGNVVGTIIMKNDKKGPRPVSEQDQVTHLRQFDEREFTIEWPPGTTPDSVMKPGDVLPLDQHDVVEHRRAMVNNADNEYLQARDAHRQAVGSGGVQPTPWMENWEEILFRDAVMGAISRGKTAIAWTTGAIQAKRYHELKSTEGARFTYNPGSETFTAYDAEGNRIFRTDVSLKAERNESGQVTRKGLASIIGNHRTAQLAKLVQELPDVDPRIFQIERLDEKGHTEVIFDTFDKIEPGDRVAVGYPDDNHEGVTMLIARGTPDDMHFVERPFQHEPHRLIPWRYENEGDSYEFTPEEARKQAESYQIQQHTTGGVTARTRTVEITGENMTVGGGGFIINYDERWGGLAKRLFKKPPTLKPMDKLEVVIIYPGGRRYYGATGSFRLPGHDVPIATGATLQEVLENMGAKIEHYPRVIHALEDGTIVHEGYEMAIMQGDPIPVEHVFRAMSEEEWQGIVEKGYMQSDGRMNLAPDEGTVAAFNDPSFYLPGKLASSKQGIYQARIVKIRLSPHWRLDDDGYVKTNDQIPIESIEEVSPLLQGERTVKVSSTGNEIPLLPRFQPVPEPAGELPVYEIRNQHGEVIAASESEYAAVTAAQNGGWRTGHYPVRIKPHPDGGGYIVHSYGGRPGLREPSWERVVHSSHSRLKPDELGEAHDLGTAKGLAESRGSSYYSVNESQATISRFLRNIAEQEDLPLWHAEIPEELAVKWMREGTPRFQATYPITGGVPVVKGAMELLGNNRYRQTIFSHADISTVIHELGHIALYDMDPEDLAILSREFAEGRDFRDWSSEDHERVMDAWEHFFMEDIAKSPALRQTFGKLMGWMRAVYQGAVGLHTPLSPDVEAVFQKRLGKVVRDANDPLPPDAALDRWGTLLAASQSELERAEARAQIARFAGTDEALLADIDDLKKQRDEAMDDDDPDLANEITNEIRAIEGELDQRDVINAVRGKRRQKMLLSRAREIEKALEKPDSRRYAGAENAANFFQDERESILREVLGAKYDEVFAGRREQMSRYLAEKGILSEDDVGEGRGFLPFRRKGTEGSGSIKQMAAPVTNRVRGKGKTSQLNLHTRNQMILWQQGDYRADIGVLHEQYLRALTFKYQLDLRSLFHRIGEPVGPEGPKKGWYLIDPDATPLPHYWKEGEGASMESIDNELARLMEGLTADDSQLALTLEKFANSWMHQRPEDAVRADGTYGNVRQVHPKTVHQLMLPYTGSQLWNPVNQAFTIGNTLARMSLIYLGPGYIPSNVLANAVMLFAERGPILMWWDMFDGARMVMKDSRLATRIIGSMDDEYRGMGNLVRAETGETITTAFGRQDTGKVLAGVRLAEHKTQGVVSALADDWMRAAAWSGAAKKMGYKTRARQLELLSGKTEKLRRDREYVAERATQAMIDFDLLSPWEQKWLRPIVFVWPFLRGATAWPVRYVVEHPARAGAAVGLSYGYGQQAQEELGDTPDYYSSLVPIDVERGMVSNVQSISPLAAAGDVVATLGAQAESAVTGDPVGAFRSLAAFLSPPSELAAMIIRGQDQFGQAISIRDVPGEAAPEFVPFWGIYQDVVDETKPAVMMDQGLAATAKRRVLRFSPQRMNLAILNAQGKKRGDSQTVSDKMVEKRNAARSAWNQLVPGEHMPRAIEDSIRAYYTVSELKAMLQDEIKTKYREGWQPTRKTPKLTPLQEAAVVYDVIAKEHPDVIADIPDPRDIYDELGEAAVDRYRAKLEAYLFKGKNAADEAIRKAKLAKKAAA